MIRDAVDHPDLRFLTRREQMRGVDHAKRDSGGKRQFAMPTALANSSRFSDVDGIHLVPGSTIEFTPLSPRVQGSQVFLRLPGLIVSSTAAFPRPVDVRLGPDCTKIGLLVD